MEYARSKQRQRNRHEPEAAQIQEHARQRIAARAEDAHDLHIGNIAEEVFQRAENCHGVGGRDRRGRQVIPRCKERNERFSRRYHRETDDQAHQRHQHGEAPCVFYAAPDFALADGFADHDHAGIAETHIERERELGKRLEDRHTRVVFVADIRVDAVERQHAERPESLVERDGKRLRVELARLAKTKRKEFPDRPHQKVLFKRREDEDQNRTQPRRDACRERRAFHTEPRQTERAEDQTIVRKGVGNRRDDRDIQRQLHPLRPAQHVGKKIRQRHRRIGKADDFQIPAACVQNSRVAVEQP